MEIRFDPRLKCCASGAGLKKISIEAFKCIEPVVVARDSVDRFFEAFERKIEIEFVVSHRASRVNNVRRDYQKLHVRPATDLEISFDKCILRMVAFPRIADDQKTKVQGSIDPCRVNLKGSIEIAAYSPQNRVDHGYAPGVDPQLRHLLIDTARPTLRVEIPAEAPDRIYRDEDSGDWKTETQKKVQRRRQRCPRILQLRGKVKPHLRPAREQPTEQGTAPQVLFVQKITPREAFNRSSDPTP